MKRHVDMADISDGRYYSGSDMVKAGCNGCGGCCKGMGQSIVLDPLDIFRMTSNLKCTFEMLLQDKVELGVVDGLIFPNLKMNGEDERCGFLNGENRCDIHGFRPGICRLFPLGRVYENHSFRYFLQIHECKNSPQVKVKVKKWLEEPDLPKQEAFICRWHYFLLDIQALLDQRADDELRKKVSMLILQSFYLEPFHADEDFYEAFEKRVAQTEKVMKNVWINGKNR